MPTRAAQAKGIIDSKAEVERRQHNLAEAECEPGIRVTAAG